jgi:hypothetical protein
VTHLYIRFLRAVWNQNGSAILRMCGSQNRRYSAPLPAGSAPYRTLPAGPEKRYEKRTRIKYSLFSGKKAYRVCTAGATSLRSFSRLIGPALRSHFRRGQGVLTRKIKECLKIENKVRPAVKSEVKISGKTTHPLQIKADADKKTKDSIRFSNSHLIQSP